MKMMKKVRNPLKRMKVQMKSERFGESNWFETGTFNRKKESERIDGADFWLEWVEK